MAIPIVRWRAMKILDLDPGNLDSSRLEPLYKQIYVSIRDAILRGQLAPGIRLPSTRALADAWQVSRSTVVLAFDHLLAEGYLHGRPGAGTFVTDSIPDNMLATHYHEQAKGQTRTTKVNGSPRTSRRGKRISNQYVTSRKLFDGAQPFRPGVPAVGTFPAELWRRLTSRIWKQVGSDAGAGMDTAGYRPLRETLATHLRATRGVQCDAEQVIIVSSTQQALMLLGQMLLDPGDRVWIEDPGYPRAQAALRAAGAKLVPIRIDSEGFDLSAATKQREAARMVYVTPSHQYPLGVTMSLARRLSLLDWCTRHNAWILEDDYFAEYRFTGRPLTALQGLDEYQRVIYLGTFSKIFSPTLRLGYLVVPPDLIEPFQAARSLIDRCPSFIDQAVLAAFIRDGYFVRHVRKLRMLYSEREAALRQGVEERVPSLTVERTDAGMHVVAWLPKGTCDRHVAQSLAQQGLIAPPLSHFALGPLSRPALVLGFAGWDRLEIERCTRRLGEITRAVLPAR